LICEGRCSSPKSTGSYFRTSTSFENVAMSVSRGGKWEV
jgi:hypothetical protein